MIGEILGCIDRQVKESSHCQAEWHVQKLIESGSEDQKAFWQMNTDEKRQVVAYNMKVFAVRASIIMAVVSVALVAFSAISLFSASLVTGFALFFGFISERGANKQADDLSSEKKDGSQTDKLKSLAQRAGAKLPDDWKAHRIEFKGIGLRNLIPFNPPKKEDSKLKEDKQLEEKDRDLLQRQLWEK